MQKSPGHAAGPVPGVSCDRAHSMARLTKLSRPTSPSASIQFPFHSLPFSFPPNSCCCWLCFVYNFAYLRRASTHYANSHDSIDYSLLNLPPLINLLAILLSHRPAQGYCNFRQNRLTITTQKAKKEIYSCIQFEAIPIGVQVCLTNTRHSQTFGFQDWLAHLSYPIGPISLTRTPLFGKYRRRQGRRRRPTIQKKKENHIAHATTRRSSLVPLLNWPRPLNPPRSKLEAYRPIVDFR